jgi:hypothetical protein
MRTPCQVVHNRLWRTFQCRHAKKTPGFDARQRSVGGTGGRGEAEHGQVQRIGDEGGDATADGLQCTGDAGARLERLAECVAFIDSRASLEWSNVIASLRQVISPWPSGLPLLHRPSLDSDRPLF